jgi:cation diffusion facilitator CzcD-associated flavoprotein CzcO
LLLLFLHLFVVDISRMGDIGEAGGAPSHTMNGDSMSYTIPETPLYSPRPIRIVCIGAGASGLDVAKNVRRLKNAELQIYEKNEAVGGTWLENRYPGCGCDIPSHNYQYSWALNPDWNEYYSGQPEIEAYFRKTARDHGLLDVIQFRHQVTEAVWDEEEGVWRFTVEDLTTGEKKNDHGHFFINASGYLNNWKWPDIPGLDTFQGELMHSAAWKEGTILKDKRVAVLGCGSSGIQVVAKVQPEVEELTTFVRTPTWVTAGFGSKYAGPGGTNFVFSEEQKRAFADPATYLRHRKDVEHELNSRFKMLHRHTPEQAAAVEFARRDMTAKLGGGGQLADFIIPGFSVGCRRPTPGNGYLEALTRPNVQVVTGTEISHLDETGLVLATGEHIPVDVFVCATGFDLSFRPRFPVVGRGGRDLRDLWSERPTAYLSLSPAHMPNYFTFLGPNSPVGHGSAIPIIEHLTKYMLRMVHKCQTEGYKSFTPSQPAIDEFVRHADAFMPRMAWASECRSWFKNGRTDGPVTALWPGSRIHWFKVLDARNIRFEDWQWERSTQNRWAFMGNGFSSLEAEGRDLTWYFDRPEEGYELLSY